MTEESAVIKTLMAKGVNLSFSRPFMLNKWLKIPFIPRVFERSIKFFAIEFFFNSVIWGSVMWLFFWGMQPLTLANTVTTLTFGFLMASWFTLQQRRWQKKLGTGDYKEWLSKNALS